MVASALALPIGWMDLSQLGVVVVPTARWTGGRSQLMPNFHPPLDTTRKANTWTLYLTFLKQEINTLALHSDPHLLENRCRSKICPLEIVCLLKQGLLVVGGVNATGTGYFSSTVVFFESTGQWTKKGELPRHWSLILIYWDGMGYPAIPPKNRHFRSKNYFLPFFTHFKAFFVYYIASLVHF